MSIPDVTQKTAAYSPFPTISSDETESSSSEAEAVPPTKTIEPKESRPESKSGIKKPSTVLPPSSPSVNPISSDDPRFLTPELSGKYNVGVKSFYADPEKKLVVDVHYPGNQTQTPTYRVLENLWSRSQPGMEAMEGKFPVVLFSHGMGQSHSDYQHLVEDLASHGYYVMTISHPASNAVSELAQIGPPQLAEDIDEEQQNILIIEGQKEIDRRAKPAMEQQANEILFLINQIREGALNERIGANMDVERIGIFGHSLGGDTALKACSQTNLIQTGIDLDNAALRHAETVEIKQPFLTIGACKQGSFGDSITWAGETWDAHEDWEKFRSISKNAVLIEIKDASHNDFLIQPLNVEYLKIYTEIRDNIVNWFNTHLKSS